MVVVADTIILIVYSSRAQNKTKATFRGVSMGLVGSSSAESDPVVTRQISRL